MSYSFTFNSVDFADYGLTVVRPDPDMPFTQATGFTQLQNRGWPSTSQREPRVIDIPVKIKAASRAALNTNIDSIKAALNTREDAELILDSLSDRYWNARFVGMPGNYDGPVMWVGTVSFVAHDPAAYSTTESDHDHTVDEDPEAMTETAGGTEQVKPVITLTCDDTLTGTTVAIENGATGERLEWTGDLVNTDVLVVDCVNGHVTLNGADSMGTVDGEFITLVPGANAITVEGFSGTVNFTYRPKYV